MARARADVFTATRNAPCHAWNVRACHAERPEDILGHDRARRSFALQGKDDFAERETRAAELREVFLSKRYQFLFRFLNQ